MPIFRSFMDLEEDMMAQIAPGGMDLVMAARVAKKTDTVSPPKLAHALKISYSQAEAALAKMAGKHLLQLVPDCGAVPVYRLTCAAYAALAGHRSRRGGLSRLFWPPRNAGLRKRLFKRDAFLAVATAEFSRSSPDLAEAQAAIDKAREQILDLVQDSVGVAEI